MRITISRNKKAQSAMEYLMTYGWAILIIAIVLAALFALNVFNPMTFAPKASAGSCQVVRPDGPGTVDFISLGGECNSEIPKYVAQFDGGYFFVPQSKFYPISNFSFSAWVYSGALPSGTPYKQFLLMGGDDCGSGDDVVGIGFQSNGLPEVTGGGCESAILPTSGNAAFKFGAWNFIVLTTNVSGTYVYINGEPTEISGQTGVFGSKITSFYFGSKGVSCCTYGHSTSTFIGDIANLQFYNTPLSENNIEALYQEGIGGDPIKIQNLIGWWPLNGNGNDYSGNGNNAEPTKVTYSGSWYTSYTPP